MTSQTGRVSFSPGRDINDIQLTFDNRMLENVGGGEMYDEQYDEHGVLRESKVFDSV